MSNYFLERSKQTTQKVASYIATLPQYVAQFFVGIENNTTPLTRAGYAMDLRIFFDYLAKEIFLKNAKNITFNDLDCLTSTDLEGFLSYLSFYTFDGKTFHNTEKGKARKLASLRSFFKYFYNKDLIKGNVTSKIPTPKQHQKEIVRLEVDEVSAMLNRVESATFDSKTQTSYNKHTSVRDLAIVTVFLGTGIRVSELVGLNINDLDLKNNAFKITRKGGSQVVLYFSDEVKDALVSHLEKRMEVDCNDNALFLSLQKKRITTRAVQNLVKKYSKQVTPLKKISPHKLRSTYGTNLYHETQDIYVVADVLGHKDVNTTKRHYAAISEDIRRSAADKVKLR